MLDSNSMKTGIFWAGAEKLFVQAIAFAQGVFLARLLSPEDFGLAAMLAIFIGVGVGLAEFGLGTVLVVRGGDSRRVLRWNVGMAIGLYVVLALGAPLIADFYGEPRLCDLTRVMAFSIVVYAMGTVPDACLQRAQRFGKIAWANGISALGSALVTVVLALRGWGVWAIAACGISSAMLRSSLLWLFCRSRGCESFDEEVSFGDTLKLGAKYALSSLINTAWVHVSALLIGKLQSPVAAGLFNRADGWTAAVRNGVNPIFARVAFPCLAEDFRVNARRVRRNALMYAGVNLAMLLPLLLMLYIWTDSIVRVIFGEQWIICVPYIRILLLGAACTPLSNVAGCLIRASGHAGKLVAGDIVRKSVGFGLLFAGCRWGLAGICWAKAMADGVDAVVNVVLAISILRRSQRPSGQMQMV